MVIPNCPTALGPALDYLECCAEDRSSNYARLNVSLWGAVLCSCNLGEEGEWQMNDNTFGPACPKCGAQCNHKGRRFSPQGLSEHIRQCRGAIQERELTDMIASDEPDGVYWAIAHEMGED